ncbi:MAG: restriction endonuclease subunit S [Candidatus Eremiobacteraeota bacterium]|nr:restriction endonuclease subunit S [Candidatus Eremiobacteraeota bacterium]
MTFIEETKALAPWTEALPPDWQVTRLDAVADVLFSNVDKHTIEGELPVRLCNYVDVYKNERITGGLDFMEASAEPREIKKFQIQPGDLLATKDSEASDDIAIAALVTEDLPGVLCGYHLALIRPRFLSVSGPFLTWLHSSKTFRAQYEAKAVGVTRFGLSQYAFRAARIPLPPLPEQQRIAAYLDASCAAIDAAVAAKHRQLETLNALRKSTIHAAVTRGLNADAKMKPADLDWLSEVPAHWTPSRIKNLAELSPSYSGRSPTNDEVCTIVPMELLSEAGTMDTTSLQTFEDVSGGLTVFETGDVLFAKITPCMENGKGAFVENLPSCYAFGSTEFHVLRPAHAINGTFLYYYTYNPVFRAYAAENMSGAAGQKRVSSRFLKETRLFVPPLPKQLEIISFITAKDRKFRSLFAQIEVQIATLTAYRKSLIHECVTGQRRITEADVAQAHMGRGAK